MSRSFTEDPHAGDERGYILKSWKCTGWRIYPPRAIADKKPCTSGRSENQVNPREVPSSGTLREGRNRRRRRPRPRSPPRIPWKSRRGFPGRDDSFTRTFSLRVKMSFRITYAFISFVCASAMFFQLPPTPAKYPVHVCVLSK